MEKSSVTVRCTLLVVTFLGRFSEVLHQDKGGIIRAYRWPEVGKGSLAIVVYTFLRTDRHDRRWEINRDNQRLLADPGSVLCTSATVPFIPNFPRGRWFGWRHVHIYARIRMHRPVYDICSSLSIEDKIIKASRPITLIAQKRISDRESTLINPFLLNVIMRDRSSYSVLIIVWHERMDSPRINSLLTEKEWLYPLISHLDHCLLIFNENSIETRRILSNELIK